MKLWEYLNVNKLEQYIDGGYVDCKYHRYLRDLMILSYARSAVYDNIWDDVTRRCRGLIVNFRTGDIVHSDHANWATNWYHENVEIPRWPDGWTPVVEMICESVQHHVVHYGWEGLVLTALINNETGEEADRDMLQQWAAWNGMECVAQRHWSIEQALKANPTNEEGYVLTWHNKLSPPLRVKVKVPEFLRLQKILHDVRPWRVFECLRDTGQVQQEWMDTMPHVTESVTKWQQMLKAEYNRIHAEAVLIVSRALQECTTRKEFAVYFHRPENTPYAPVCFALLDEHDYQRVIWKLVEPLAKSLAAKQEDFEEDLSSRTDIRTNVSGSADLARVLCQQD